MLKLVETAVTMAEVPDEITLAINIAGCPIHCPDCHSKYLWEDTGEPLTQKLIEELIAKNENVTCIAFMGGDQAPEELNHLAFSVKCLEQYPFKTAWYSGRQELSPKIDLVCFDYIKLGPFIKEKGPLNKRTTNQRFYKISPEKELIDITEKFWK